MNKIFIDQAVLDANRRKQAKIERLQILCFALAMLLIGVTALFTILHIAAKGV